jgi:DNA mismatch endonuclease, patch repair protein
LDQQRGAGHELHLRRALWSVGLRYRKHLKVSQTTPDLVFKREHVAVFVDGCFWHGCPRHYKAPIGNAEFWRNRLSTNQTRDARDTLRLQSIGWIVIRVWECELRCELDTVVARIRQALST